MEKKVIGLIGAGSMGTALGKLLIKAGYGLIVWNRTPAKIFDLEREGAVVAKDLRNVLEISNTIILCVSDYAASGQILEPVLTKANFQHKTVIQLSTGSPQDAVEFSARFSSVKANYLDGAIAVTPSQMGSTQAMIVVAGHKGAYQEHEGMLKVLAPNTLYVGDKASLAAAWDLAFLSYFFSALIGFTHASVIAKAEGIDMVQLGSMIEDWSPAVGSIMKDCAAVIAKGNFQGSESTVRTCAIASELILRHAKQAQISSTYPRFALGVFDKAMQAGLTSEDGIAIFKSL